MNAVLMSDGQLRKTLAAVRSLGSKGVPAYVSETSRFNPSAFSRYCSGSFICPDPYTDRSKFVNWLADTLIRRNIRVLFPMDDIVMKAVMDHRGTFEDICALPLPSNDSYDKAADKGKAAELAERAKVPLPMTIRPQSLPEIERIAGLTFPLVIKPRFSSGSRGIRVVGNPQDLLAEYADVHKEYPLPLVQEFIPSGDRYDVCLLYDQEGILRASFVQKELRHFPLERGPSTVQESVDRPDLVELAVSIMGQLNWRGIAEIEFMVDPRDGLPKFMEINPRFWNSLYTSMLSGVDFPWLLYRMACGEKLESTFTYRTGIRCRSLLPGDILHYISNPRRNEIMPAFWAGAAKGGTDDIWSRDDPLPTIGFILACLRYLPDPHAWRRMFDRS